MYINKVTANNSLRKKFAKNRRISDGLYVTFRAEIRNLVNITELSRFSFLSFREIPRANAERLNTDKLNRSYPTHI